jgi:hypothetical protein
MNTISIKWWKMQKTKVHWNFYTWQKLDADIAIISGQAVELNHSHECFLTSCRLAHCSMKWAVFSVSCLHIGQRELTSPFLANFALCSCRVSVPVSVGTTINEYYINQMVKDAENKSSLKFLHLTETRYGHCHNIWSSCGTEPFADWHFLII